MHERVRDPTCARDSEIKRGNEVYQTTCARDEVMHLGGFKGSLQMVRINI